ncbi:hypothetical protein KKE68_05085, partial [Patescibacteria group bacterium]|nr:hypothetical protein [Patescibacteria group bacterium]
LISVGYFFYFGFIYRSIDRSFFVLVYHYTFFLKNNFVSCFQRAVGEINTAVNKSKIKKIAYRNQFFFVWLNITDKELLLSHILYLPYHLLTFLLRKDWYFYFGFFFALLKINKILEKRKKYTKLFTKTDKEILVEFKV